MASMTLLFQVLGGILYWAMVAVSVAMCVAFAFLLFFFAFQIVCAIAEIFRSNKPSQAELARRARVNIADMETKMGMRDPEPPMVHNLH